RPGALLVYPLRLGLQVLAILLLKASTESQVVVPDGGTPFEAGWGVTTILLMNQSLVTLITLSWRGR
ncbi:hypothetical protein, partial [Aeromonas piscicola]|uniref:hypothetical protein n=1 Tax=Aeromonas piscicola TaxID=600645 RepID=UPI001ADEEC85